MDSKEKRMALIFAMFFVASLVVTLSFNLDGDVTGEAVKEFNLTKEKSNYCEVFCDEELSKTNPAYDSWTGCHEDCMKN